MATATSEVGAFPSPFSIETPAGCEGWTGAGVNWIMWAVASVASPWPLAGGFAVGARTFRPSIG